MAVLLKWDQAWNGTSVIWHAAWSAGDGYNFAPGAIALSGTFGVSGNVASFDRRYYVIQTTPVGLSGGFTHTSAFATVRPYYFEPPLRVGPLAGVLGVSGNIGFVTNSFKVQQTAVKIGLSGASAVSGALGVGTRLNVVATQPVRVNGVGVVVGTLGYTFNNFPLVQTATKIGLSGTFTTSGNIATVNPGPFALVQGATKIGLAGQSTVAGQPRSTVSWNLVQGATKIGITGLSFINAKRQLGTPAANEFRLVAVSYGSNSRKVSGMLGTGTGLQQG